MCLITPETLSQQLWKLVYRCGALVLIAAAMATLRLTALDDGPGSHSEHAVEMAFWRVGLLLSFHSAPWCWASMLCRGYKRRLIPLPLYEVLWLLRMPVATWSAGCLLISLMLWPQLSP
jgi:hypothetical protein